MLIDMTKTFLAALFVSTLAFTGIAQEKAKTEPKAPEGVSWEQDVVFGKGGDSELHLDIARPKDSGKPLACIVVIHGGGWRGGNFKVHVPQIFDFAKAGYVSATVQ